MDKQLGFETLQLHGGQTVDKTSKSRAVPIYQTASYLLGNTEEAELLFSGDKFGFTYTRTANPTTEVLEKRMALLEGGLNATVLSSGTSAVIGAILNLTESGDEIISAKNLYGGTYTIFKNTLPQYGINVNFFEPSQAEQLKNLITEKTKAIYLESIGNPNAELIDLKLISQIAHEYGIAVIVDNTFASPYLYRPIDCGADIVVHSLTKFVGGHGTTIAGIVVNSGNFDFNSNPRYSLFQKSDSNIGGKKYSDFGKSAYNVRMKKRILTDFGACLSPLNSFLILQGLETLSLRMERHRENTLKIIEFLENHPKVQWLSHPEAKNSLFKEILLRDFKKGAGSIFTFGLQGGVEAGKKFIENLKIFSHLANVADAKSLIIHPASTTHAQLSKEQQEYVGIKPETIRISVGLENVYDLIDDLETALLKI